MREVVIAPAEKGKGRSFRATCLGLVQCDPLWAAGTTGHTRPVWAMFAGSEQELRPFVANLVTGRRVEFDSNSRRSDWFEFLRTAGFRVTWQRELEGAVVTVFLPELFELDPGMVDPDGASFIVMPSVAWADTQKIDAAPIREHMAKFDVTNSQALELDPAVAFLFASYLDRRTRFPLYADGRFYMQLLLACLAQGLASWPDSHRHEDFGVNHMLRLSAQVEELGLVRPIAFSATHEQIGALLDEQVSLFIEAVEDRPVKRKLGRG